MTDIVKVIQRQPDLYVMNAASDESIRRAEQKLKLQFATDYRRYVAAFGAVSFANHELTGVCTSKRLCVVDVTIEERARTNVPSDWYVLEQANIDGIVIWQSSDGNVYQVAADSKAKKLCGSLTEYFTV